MRKLEFNLYDAPIAGNKVWGPQVFDNVPIIGGRFNVILGATDTGERSLVGAFGASQRYLGFKVGAVGQDLANVVEMAPRQQILSAPYALVAEKVKQLDEVLFPDKNTDWARIVFESQGDGPHQSNMVFETFDNNDEGFVFRSNTTERLRIDDRGVTVPGRLVVGEILGNGKGIAASTRLQYVVRDDELPGSSPNGWYDFLSYEVDVGVDGSSVLIEPDFALANRYVSGSDPAGYASCQYVLEHRIGSSVQSVGHTGIVVLRNLAAGHYAAELTVHDFSGESGWWGCSEWGGLRPAMKVFVIQ